MKKKTIKNLSNLKGKRVLVRVDYNVPIDEGVIVDNSRIVKSLETISYLLEKGAKLIIFSHLGRIKSDADKKVNSLLIVAKELEKLLKIRVFFSKETRGKKLETMIDKIENGQILLVENTRFEDFVDGKKSNYESGCDQQLSKYWASLGEIFVNDAFGTLHRKHASNYGISKNIKTKVIGFLVAKELAILNELREKPKRPFVVILGGAKVSDKVAMINAMIKLADKVIIGPAMSYTFQLSNNQKVGNSLIDKSKIDYARDLWADNKEKLFISFDSIATDSLTSPKSILKNVEEIPDQYIGADIGEKSLTKIVEYLKNAKTIFWNGPLGVVEKEEFSHGSKYILDFIANLKDVTTIIGGGDSGMMATKFNMTEKLTHVSTGGGASMKFLEGDEMPSLTIIDDYR